jgi:hypothetical protein
MNMKLKRFLVIFTPVLLVPLLYFLGVFISQHYTFPPCITYSLFHINCPGCGMTRSVIALLNGDILLSIRQNVFVIMLIIIALMIYIEYVLKVFGVKFKFPIHNKYFLYGGLIFLIVFSVLRNLVPVLAPV